MLLNAIKLNWGCALSYWTRWCVWKTQQRVLLSNQLACSCTSCAKLSNSLGKLRRKSTAKAKFGMFDVVSRHFGSLHWNFTDGNDFELEKKKNVPKCCVQLSSIHLPKASLKNVSASWKIQVRTDRHSVPKRLAEQVLSATSEQHRRTSGVEETRWTFLATSTLMLDRRSWKVWNWKGERGINES